MRQRVLLASDRDLLRPHSHLLQERPYALLPLGLVGADQVTTHYFPEFAASSRCNSGRPVFDLLAQRLGGLVENANLGTVRFARLAERYLPFTPGSEADPSARR